MFLDELSILGVFWGLFGTFIGYHFVLEGHQQILHGGGILPGIEEGQFLNSSVILVDGGDVDFVVESDYRRLLWVLWATVD